MPARVLAIGLDAASATLIERWAEEGWLPTFAELERGGAVYDLESCLETLPGGIWSELASGRSVGRLPLYFHPSQLFTGEARRRPIREQDVDPRDYFWAVASEAGRRVAALDVPQTVLAPGLHGVQLSEWGVHDRYFRVATEPPELLAELRARHGDHPVARMERQGFDHSGCDHHRRRRAGYEALRERILEGVARKTALLHDVLEREAWDLFVGVYAESHCVGHQFWHLLDPAAARHDPDAPEPLRSAIRDVYRRIDEGIGSLIDVAGPDTAVIVFASHGMGPYIAGPQLLPEVLVRLGMASGGSTPGASAVRALHRRLLRLPGSMQALLRPLGEGGPVRRLLGAAGSLLDPFESADTRAAHVANNRAGAIRLNLRGREPHGRIEPGADAEALLAELRRELLALEDPASGERIASRVVTAAEAFGPDHHPDVPDLMIAFRTDLGPLEACHSARVGTVRVPIANPNFPRSGDHVPDSRLWMKGPDVPRSFRSKGNVLDLAPTVLELLGVDAPARLDGRPLQRPAPVEPRRGP